MNSGAVPSHVAHSTCSLITVLFYFQRRQPQKTHRSRLNTPPTSASRPSSCWRHGCRWSSHWMSSISCKKCVWPSKLNRAKKMRITANVPTIQRHRNLATSASHRRTMWTEPITTWSCSLVDVPFWWVKIQRWRHRYQYEKCSFLLVLHQASASVKVKPVQPRKHKRPRMRQQERSWQNDCKSSYQQVHHKRDITASDLAYRRDFDALKYKLSITLLIYRNLLSQV